MKICYVCPDLGIPLDGTKGASAHVRGLVRAYGALGHDVMVVAGTAESDAGLGVPVRTIPRPSTHTGLILDDAPKVVRALGHLWNNIELEHVLHDIFRSFEPDLVYERYSPFGAATGQVARAHGIPHVLEVNALLAEEGKKYRGQALGEASVFLEEVAFKAPKMVVTVSEALREAVLEFRTDAKSVLTVPNGVDTDRFSSKGPVAEIGKPGDTVIGFVGGLRPWHGIDRIATLFRALCSDPDYHLLVVGDGPERKLLRKLAEEFPDRITLTRNVPHDEVPALTRAMDIALAPYPVLDRFYFSPLKILEYMACGCAIVASSIGQVSELIADRETGLLVPPGDDAALLEAVKALKSDRALRERLGSTAADRIAAGYDWTARAQDILNHLATLETTAAQPCEEASHG